MNMWENWGRLQKPLYYRYVRTRKVTGYRLNGTGSNSIEMLEFFFFTTISFEVTLQN